MFQNFQVQTYAGFWIRFAAYLIDTILLSLIFLPLGFVLGLVIALGNGGQENEPALALLSVFIRLVSLLTGWLYFAWLESSAWQATVGKKLCGLRVTDLNGFRISFGKASGRYFGKILSGIILCIGFIMIAFSDQKQGLHDQLAGTLVLSGQAVPVYPEPPAPPDFSYRGSGFTPNQQ